MNKEIKLSDIKETIPLAKALNDRFSIVIEYLINNHSDPKKVLSNMDCICEHLSELAHLKNIIDGYIRDLNVIKPRVLALIEETSIEK